MNRIENMQLEKTHELDVNSHRERHYPIEELEMNGESVVVDDYGGSEHPIWWRGG